MALSQESTDKYLELCASVGVLSPDMTAFDAFLMAGKITGDQIVMKRRVWNSDGTFRREQLADGTFRAVHFDTFDVLEEMTDAEKAELRERVLR